MRAWRSRGPMGRSEPLGKSRPLPSCGLPSGVLKLKPAGPGNGSALWWAQVSPGWGRRGLLLVSDDLMIGMRRGWCTPKCSLRVPLSLVGSQVPARQQALGRRTKAQPFLSVLLFLLLPPVGCSVLAAFLGLTPPTSGKGASFSGHLVRGCGLAYLLEVWPSRSLEVGAFSARLSECCWAPSPRPGVLFLLLECPPNSSVPLLWAPAVALGPWCALCWGIPPGQGRAACGQGFAWIWVPIGVPVFPPDRQFPVAHVRWHAGARS